MEQPHFPPMTAAELERKLTIIHQQYITTEMQGIRRQMQAHDKELMLLTLVIVACAASTCYAEYRINRMEKRHVLGRP